MQSEDVKEVILNGTLDKRFAEIYVQLKKVPYQKERYMQAVKVFEEKFGAGEIGIYSAPGRSEICGNHTDHQHGKVLAVSINLDAIAVVRKTEGDKINVVSEGFDMITVSPDDLCAQEDEKQTAKALVKGILAEIQKKGYKIGAFDAYITSDVLVGAGLSSSAAFETLIGTIISYLYNDGHISATEIAMIGQYAENVYFGKPCGLMDQMACSVGNLVSIDFADAMRPEVERLEFDLQEYGYSLCIVDTKGSHADLTTDYADIPQEMTAVANFLGKEVLVEVTENEFYQKISEIRTKLGDRAVLRAIHFMEENKRVEQAVEALKTGNMERFLAQIKASGASSFQYLQNVYTSDVFHQNMSVALAVSDIILQEKGVARVHGGGFAGTIQAFVKTEFVEEYQRKMNAFLGDGACCFLQVRKFGGVQVL